MNLELDRADHLTPDDATEVVLRNGFKEDITNYLAEPMECQVGSLKELVVWKRDHTVSWPSV